jgi:small subunit ribosomal protein S16
MIRLKPIGRKGNITYRVVVSEKRSKLVGKMVDDLGHYNKLTNPPQVEIDRNRVMYWQEKGAQVYPTVKKLLELK